MLKHVGLFYLLSKEKEKEIESSLNSIRGLLQEKSVPYTIINGLEIVDKKSFEEIDLLISLGGDGTILHASNFVRPYGIPILAVSSGYLGFLAEIKTDQCEWALDQLLKNAYFYDERPFLKASLNRKDWYALNEFVVDGVEHKLIEVDVYINDLCLTTYKSDGLIFSTSTGSTAYSLSAGGPIVFPDIELMMITPISPHTLTVRPLIISPGDELKVCPKQEAVLLNDGQLVRTMNKGDFVYIKLSDQKVKFVRFNEHSFVDGLINKLNWNGKFLS